MTQNTNPVEGAHIYVQGIVQGVGFRPFVYRLAHEYNLAGWVLNARDGVTIHVEGAPEDIDAFVIQVSEHHPSAAVVEKINIDEAPLEPCSGFEIRESATGDVRESTLVSPDLATCSQCVRELFDETDRRYRYPFINCTNCGPRFTIIDELPYDRPATSMNSFEMCGDCAAEYHDPMNRRFHAQPDACFECGPSLGWLERAEAIEALGLAPTNLVGASAESSAKDTLCVEAIAWAQNREQSDAMISRAVEVLRAGGIVAVKGLGGYHLVCDAANEQALVNLRSRKQRSNKAFAVMVATAEDARAYCEVSAVEEKQLTTPVRPIVLLKKKPGAQLAKGLADGLAELGVMLPSTPVQHLLMHDFGGMLVMTSGNVHDEPIVTTEAAALEQLGHIADAFLVNNRPIKSRYDDSVLRVVETGDISVVQVIRRARGLAPRPVVMPLPEGMSKESASKGSAAKEGTNGSAADCAAVPCILAVGPEQKNTFTLTQGANAFVSQHMGDMDSVPVYDAWLEGIDHYQQLFDAKPNLLAADYHPEYLTTKWAEKAELSVCKAQHHHAHIVATMAENNLFGPVCGIAFDGTGYGLDGAIWGGEVLLSNLHAFERFANFAYMPLPGGAAAIKKPERFAYSVLWSCDLLEHPSAVAFVEKLGSQANLIEQMIEQGINTPMTSSVGRLFDAASALLGICTEPTYEGEAAIALEAAVHTEGLLLIAKHPEWETTPEGYRIEVLKNTATETSTAQDTSILLLDPAPVFEAVLDDIAAGIPAAIIAKRFHDAFVEAILNCAELVRAMYGIEIVTLSGGVFMNRYLLEKALSCLAERGFTVALNRELPPNDASISYGQAVLALHSHE